MGSGHSGRQGSRADPIPRHCLSRFRRWDGKRCLCHKSNGRRRSVFFGEQLLLQDLALYGERVGALSVVCNSRETTDKVLGQLKATVRRNYSSPPRHGAEIVTRVLTMAGLTSVWLREVEEMRLRIQVARLRDEFGIYLLSSGRLCVAGLNEANVGRVALAISKV